MRHANGRIPNWRIHHLKLTSRWCAAGLERDMLLELLSADDLTVFSEMQVCHQVLCDPQSMMFGH